MTLIYSDTSLDISFDARESADVCEKELPRDDN